MQWNDNGEIMYQGDAVKNSNIIQLIKHAIENDRSKPVGMKLFYKKLGSSNIPNTLISNVLGLNIINKIRKQRNYLWRPPGRVNK